MALMILSFGLQSDSVVDYVQKRYLQISGVMQDNLFSSYAAGNKSRQVMMADVPLSGQRL